MSRNRTKSNWFKSADLLAAQIAAVRDECNRAADALSNRSSLSEVTLRECARLGDSLEATQRFLKFSVAQIAIMRRKRRRGEARLND
jgi:hypothetical protein